MFGRKTWWKQPLRRPRHTWKDYKHGNKPVYSTNAVNSFSGWEIVGFSGCLSSIASWFALLQYRFLKYEIVQSMWPQIIVCIYDTCDVIVIHTQVHHFSYSIISSVYRSMAKKSPIFLFFHSFSFSISC